MTTDLLRNLVVAGAAVAALSIAACSKPAPPTTDTSASADMSSASPMMDVSASASAAPMDSMSAAPK